MEQNNIIEQKIKKLSFYETEESIRYELYAIFTSLILSKEIFKQNKEIVAFLKNFNIVFKPYVIKSRTSILSKVLRIVNSQDKEKLKKTQKILIKSFDEYINEQTIKKEGNGYVENVLRKYKRDNIND